LNFDIYQKNENTENAMSSMILYF